MINTPDTAMQCQVCCGNAVSGVLWACCIQANSAAPIVLRSLFGLGAGAAQWLSDDCIEATHRINIQSACK